MLTFFEYLRQRAFESVLAGAQEALDFLEQQQALTEPKKQLPRMEANGNGDSPKPPRKREEPLVKSHSKPLNKTFGNDPLHKNGKAGRPSSNGTGQK